MKKKIIAILAIAAMVVTMFSTVSFAAVAETFVSIGGEEFHDDIVITASSETKSYGFLSGTITIDFANAEVGGGTLVYILLDNAVINCQNGSSEEEWGLGIYNAQSAYIELAGENKITVNETTEEDGMCLAVEDTENLVITGDGSLVLAGKNRAAISGGNFLTFVGGIVIDATIENTEKDWFPAVDAGEEITFALTEGGKVSVKTLVGGEAVVVGSPDTINLGENNVITTPKDGYICGTEYVQFIAEKGSTYPSSIAVVEYVAPEKPEPDVPKTGDSNTAVLYVALAAMALAGLGFAVKKIRVK